MTSALKTVGRVIPGVGDAIAARDAGKRSERAYRDAARVSAAQAERGSQALRASLAPSLAALGSGEALARGELIGAQNRQLGMLQPMADTGMGAYQSQAALSGALGPEAQQLAISAFQDSPEQQYLREQGEQAIMRQASATGGVGGSRVLEALQRQGIGMAAQNFQNQFNRLGAVAEPGMQATMNQANIVGQTGANLANIAQSMAAARSSIHQAQGTGLANIAVGQAAQQANAALGAGQARAAGILGVQGGINKAAGMAMAAMTGNPFAAMGSMGGGNQMWNSRAASGLAGVGQGGGIGL